MWTGPRPTSYKVHLDPSSHLATTDMDRKLRGLCPFSGGAGSPSNTMSPGPSPISVPSAKWHLDPSSHGLKMGGGAVPLFGGSWVPITHNVAWAKAYLHTKWHFDPLRHLATIDRGRKFGAAVPPFSGGELGPHLMQCRLGQCRPPYQVAS